MPLKRGLWTVIWAHAQKFAGGTSRELHGKQCQVRACKHKGLFKGGAIITRDPQAWDLGTGSCSSDVWVALPCGCVIPGREGLRGTGRACTQHVTWVRADPPESGLSRGRPTASGSLGTPHQSLLHRETFQHYFLDMFSIQTALVILLQGSKVKWISSS